MDTWHRPAWEFGRQALETGELGAWDLLVELETVHHSPQWKLRLGFPEPHSADSTHFWRCRVHPEDLEPMQAAMRGHARGDVPSYECRFRLRSNGSGYRLMHSRGRVIERGPDGRALRMVGTMLDLTERAPTPQGGLPAGPRGLMAGAPLALPFHRLIASLADTGPATVMRERNRVLDLVDDVMQASVTQLGALRTAQAAALAPQVILAQ